MRSAPRIRTTRSRTNLDFAELTGLLPLYRCSARRSSLDLKRFVTDRFSMVLKTIRMWVSVPNFVTVPILGDEKLQWIVSRLFLVRIVRFGVFCTKMEGLVTLNVVFVRLGHKENFDGIWIHSFEDLFLVWKEQMLNITEKNWNKLCSFSFDESITCKYGFWIIWI